MKVVDSVILLLFQSSVYSILQSIPRNSTVDVWIKAPAIVFINIVCSLDLFVQFWSQYLLYTFDIKWPTQF